jgi:tetratricopeptide (TPR) repeat protein
MPRPKKPKSAGRPKKAQPEAPVSGGRKWLFRLAAVILLPVLVLGGIELVLRLAGYGHPTGFFQKIRIGDKEYLVNNEDFSLRFFPPQLARWPGPVMFEAARPANTYRIFILGESAARGEPEPNYAASRYLKALLEDRHPQTHFEVANLGITAIDSHVILPMARDCAGADGQLWIIYMGNNEMVGPFGAATVFGAKAPPLAMVRLNLAVQKTRLGQWLTELSRKLRGKGANESWGGMKMFLGNEIRADDPRREIVYQNFARNLEDIVQTGLNSGAKILLSTVAVNLKDCPPFGSLTNANLSAGDQAQFAGLLAEAKAAAAQKDFAAAAQKFESAAKLDPQFPELQFRWAQCLLETGNAAAAREHFQKACDLDALPFRADTRINGAIAAVGKKFAGDRLAFFDAAAALSAQAPDGICGRETFYEHVHFNFDGEFRLGRAWASLVETMLPPEITAGASTNGWASQETCEARLGLTDWNRCEVVTTVIDRLHKPPLGGQFNNPERLATLREEERSLRARMKPATEGAATGIYLAAIARDPEDQQLHENYAEFLETSGQVKEALAEREKMLALLPHDCGSYYQAGRLLNELNRFDEAEHDLLSAVALRPRMAEGWVELGNCHLGGGKFAQAVEDFNHAAELNPSDAMNPGLAGRALAKLNRHDEAIADYQKALEMQPDLWEVRIALGDELVATDKMPEAVQAYAEAVRVKPDNVLAHMDLAVLLARTGKFDEALQEFDAVLRLDPGNQQALEYRARVQGWKAQGLDRR